MSFDQHEGHGGAETRPRPTIGQVEHARSLTKLMAAGIQFKDASELVSLNRDHGGTERTKVILAFVVFGIPFAEAVEFADTPGLREALLACIREHMIR